MRLAARFTVINGRIAILIPHRTALNAAAGNICVQFPDLHTAHGTSQPFVAVITHCRKQIIGPLATQFSGRAVCGFTILGGMHHTVVARAPAIVLEREIFEIRTRSRTTVDGITIRLRAISQCAIIGIFITTDVLITLNDFMLASVII